MGEVLCTVNVEKHFCTMLHVILCNDMSVMLPKLPFIMRNRNMLHRQGFALSWSIQNALSNGIYNFEFLHRNVCMYLSKSMSQICVIG